MIRYECHGDTYSPVIVCDACDRPVDNGHGNVYWLVATSDGASLPGVWFTHKHPCSNLDRVLQEENPATWCYSEELDVWLKQLSHNASHPLSPRRRAARGQ